MTNSWTQMRLTRGPEDVHGDACQDAPLGRRIHHLQVHGVQLPLEVRRCLRLELRTGSLHSCDLLESRFIMPESCDSRLSSCRLVVCGLLSRMDQVRPAKHAELDAFDAGVPACMPA